MSSPSAGKRRMDTDVVKLIEGKHEVTILGGLNEFAVKFFGPKDTPYEDGVWRVRVELPENYPFKSPSIGFMNKIYHPNIDEASGTVCLDVINQTWTPLYDLANIFESFLPQLLSYPNPTDPLNGDAAALYLHQPDEFKRKCRDYVQRYATLDALKKYCPSTDGPSCFQNRPDSHGNPLSNGTSTTGSSAVNGVATSSVAAEEESEPPSPLSTLSDDTEDELTRDMEL